MPEYTTWDESKGRIEDRFARHEEVLAKISGSIEKVVWLLVSGILVLAGHAIMSYIQMAAKH